MRFLRRRPAVPAALTSAFGADERLLAGARTVDGALLAATRYGLWELRGDEASRTGWHLVSKARLTGRTLLLTAAHVLGTWPDGTVLLVDEPERALELEHSTRLTDLVHHRVRGSVAASTRLDWPGAGGWVVLRKVPGQDGLTVQVRLDDDADSAAPGFAEAVAEVVEAIWPESVPRGASEV